MGKIIKTITIKNFRGIENKTIELNNLTMLIGDNGTNKTSILEAINFAFSPSFLSGRIKHTDFKDGNNNSIEIVIEFENNFKVSLPDGYTSQEVECNKIILTINKREKKSPGKVLSDLVTIEHIVLPDSKIKKLNDKWSIERKGGNEFKFDKRLLSFNVFQSDDLPRTFYFNKERDKQIHKGFNSSFSAFVDDLNWRYSKATKEISNSNFISELFTKIDEIENNIINLSKVEQHDVIKEFNKRLKDMGLDDTDFSFIDKSAPFDQVFLSKKMNFLNLPLKYLGSGIEMIYSILFLDALASLSRENLIILIDEPELHLHPNLQEKFANYLYKLSENKKYQIIITTHSPIFFKHLCNRDGVMALITKKDNEFEIMSYEPKQSIFPWGPTWGEINYFAYDYPTVEFHNELYGYLQEITEKTSCNDLDDYLNSHYQIPKDKKWTPEKNGQPQSPKHVTLMTFIRHKIHHPENKTMQSENFDGQKLKESIEKMIKIIKDHSSADIGVGG